MGCSGLVVGKGMRHIMNRITIEKAKNGWVVTSWDGALILCPTEEDMVAKVHELAIEWEQWLDA